MSAEAASWLAIALATVVTFATRFLGPVLMTRIPSSTRLLRFLDHLSLSVIVAMIASFLAKGSLREATAVAVGAAVMMLFRKAWLSMVCAVAVAALWTGLSGG